MPKPKSNTHLITIDPQNDFCHAGDPKEADRLAKSHIPESQWPVGVKPGALFVGGADQDMKRLADFVARNQSRIAEIHCTVDSHQIIHIAHPIFWVDSKGNNPSPFTLITKEDVKNGVWRTYNPRWQAQGLNYVEALAKDTPDHPKRYDLCIWPEHCLIGTWGHSLVPAVAQAFGDWERKTFNRVDYVAKGSNLFTEHYSGVMADVPDDTDDSTKLNVKLIGLLAEPDVDEILITGEALSHCVANTIRDIANNFGDDNIKKFTLLKDTTSPVGVGDGPQKAQDFMKEMLGRGMKQTTTKDW